MTDLVFSAANATQCSAIAEQLAKANFNLVPLHEVQAINLAATTKQGKLIGGILGRVWQQHAEINTLWVDVHYRKRSIGRNLLQQFEQQLLAQNCTTVYLETFSFQAPDFYKKYGYQVIFVRTNYPHGICKYMMSKMLVEPEKN